jgi:glycosyltransferase involved in cell wall biosynthesis
LRIAVVSSFVDRRHGTERALAELLERLTNNFGCEVHLYSQRVEALAINAARSRQPAAGVLVWHRVPFVPGPHVFRFLCWIFLNWFYRARDFFIRGLRFDLVLSPGINCLDADVILVHAVFQRLAELHEDAASDGLRTFHRSLYYRTLRFLERRVYRNPNVSLAGVSQRTAAQLRQCFGRTEVRVIPNGVDAHVFHPGARSLRRASARQRWGFAPHELVLLLIGNDWKNKGVPTLLEAVALCRELPLRMLIVGEENPATFVGAISKHQLAGRVSFSQPAKDVLDLYAAADVYVSPSREDSFGMPVAEAMACGLPVITSVFAGVSDLIHHEIDGFILQDPGDSVALAQFLARLQGDEMLRRSIGEAAAMTAQEWTWDRNAEAVWQLLKDGAAKKGSTHVLPAES